MDNNSVIETIQECLIDYSTPIFVVGELIYEGNDTTTAISATISKDQLIIQNNKYPEWYEKIINNSFKRENILYIYDFELISTEEQKLFIDIICNNSISCEKFPENLKIIINAKTECDIIPEIKEVIQYFELR